MSFVTENDRFMLQRKWQYEVSKAVARAQQSRQVQQRNSALAQDDDSPSSFRKRRVRVDVVRALMNARIKDDHVERIKIKSAEHIATQLEQNARVQDFTSLQDRYVYVYSSVIAVWYMNNVCGLIDHHDCSPISCLYEIARTFDCYSSTCPFTEEFFGTFEPWMITRLSELTTAFKTMGDANVALLLQQPTEVLTLGFVRDERALAPLFVQHESDRQRMAWQLNPLGGLQQQVESWDELDVDDVDIVHTHDVVHLQTLELISCAGLTLQFVGRLSIEHPFIEHFKVIDCFDTLDGADGAELLLQVASWRSLKTLHFSWCCWLTTEMLVTLAYLLLESRAPVLVEFHVSDCFDVLEDYVRSLFAELHPHVRLTF